MGTGLEVRFVPFTTTCAKSDSEAAQLHTFSTEHVFIDHLLRARPSVRHRSTATNKTDVVPELTG